MLVMVKEDLSKLSKTISRQLWGVASFVTPPPSDSRISDLNSEDDSNSTGIDGIRSDLSEIKGKFCSGIAKDLINKDVSKFGKIASNILQFVSKEGETLQDYAQRGVIGVTEEVWPLLGMLLCILRLGSTFLFLITTAKKKQEHAFFIERLAPRLADLKN